MPGSPPVDTQTGLREFNEATEAELRARVHECLAVPRWVERLVAGRPYPDLDSLLAASDAASASLTDDEVRAAVAAHPRIGEGARGDSASARWSSSEQSGVSREASVQEQLADANAEYERRFGHVYLVCATGKDGAQILADLRSRLDNDEATELGVIRQNLGEIAKMRLAKVVGA
jgi:2-oxo-4-hydroxy-4-carboxy-5-ureidoimidazoline decarboxylase